VAIAACDLAEVIGAAIAFNLLRPALSGRGPDRARRACVPHSESRLPLIEPSSSLILLIMGRCRRDLPDNGPAPLMAGSSTHRIVRDPNTLMPRSASSARRC
jgi:hypothetical protein